MSEVFISYAREDRELAASIYQTLSSAGINVFWDEKLNPGEIWPQRLQKALQSARAVIVLWTESSVDSAWVYAEASEAHHRQCLIPAIVGKASPPMPFGQLQSIRLKDGFSPEELQTFLRQILHAIERLVNLSPTEPSAASHQRPISTKENSHERSFSYLLLSFDGRIGRKHYWLALLILIPIQMIVFLVVKALYAVGVSDGAPISQIISEFSASLVSGFLFMPAFIKRLHDINLSGVLAAPYLFFSCTLPAGMEAVTLWEKQSKRNAPEELIVSVLVISFLVILITALLGCVKGSRGENKYG